MDSAELEGSLEHLLDQSSLSDLLQALGQVCYEKADHLRSNWQDRSAASDWDSAAGRVQGCGNYDAIKRVS